MNLQDIKDVEKLKALAYDQLVAKQQAEYNLQAITERIAQLNAPADNKVAPKSK